LFSPTRNQADASHEFIIGGDNNQYSYILDGYRGNEVVRVETPDILSGSDYNDFWIDWTGGNVRVGNGQNVGQDIFMTWDDSRRFRSDNVGISTYDGVTGNWIIVRDTEIITPPRYEYNWVDDFIVR
ncbi:unnamed protein product, partial [Owenia fusiformis]